MNDTAALPSTAGSDASSGAASAHAVDAIVSRAPAPAALSAGIPVDLDEIHEQALVRLGRGGGPLPPG